MFQRYLQAAHMETNFYELFLRDQPPFPLPKCYGVMKQDDARQRPALILMEDLSDTCISPPILPGLTPGQLTNVS